MEDKTSREILKRSFSPETDIRNEWNKMVQGFVVAEQSWERLKELLFVTTTFEKLDLLLQRRLNQVCRTTKFGYATASLVDLLGIRGKVEDLLIEVNKKENNNEE